MEFLGVGPMELLLILVIALIVLGPNDMVKTGRMLGRVLRQIVTSPLWKTIQTTSQDLRTIPTKLMREAGMEEDVEELKKLGRDLDKEAAMLRSLQKPLSAAADDISQEVKTTTQGLSAWTTPPTAVPAGEKSTLPEPNIAPPSLTTPVESPQAEIFTPPSDPNDDTFPPISPSDSTPASL